MFRNNKAIDVAEGTRFTTERLQLAVYLHASGRLRFSGCIGTDAGRIKFVFDDPTSIAPLLEYDFDSGAPLPVTAVFASQKYLRREMDRANSNRKSEHTVSSGIASPNTQNSAAMTDCSGPASQRNLRPFTCSSPLKMRGSLPGTSMGPAEERGSRSGAGYKALSNRYRVSAIERIGMCVADGSRTWYSILSGCAGFRPP